MNTKAISLTIVFTALTVALNPNLTGIFLAAPYAPFLIYQIWEIPIVAAIGSPVQQKLDGLPLGYPLGA